MNIVEIATKKLQAAQLRVEIAKVDLELAKTTGQNAPTPAQKQEARKLARVAKYKTSNGLTIHKLRLNDNKVSVTHLRNSMVLVKRGDGYVSQVVKPVPSYLRRHTQFNTKGGATYIVITEPNGDEHAVSSFCHDDDCFDYKLAVKLALDKIPQTTADRLINYSQKQVAAPVAAETALIMA